MSGLCVIAGTRWIEMITAAAAAIGKRQDDLNALDSTVGDGDHGTNIAAALAKAAVSVTELPEPAPEAVLNEVGSTLATEMGGAAGVIFGAFFRGAALGTAGKAGIDAPQYVEVLRSGLKEVQKWGKARPGDKTMVDALAAALRAAEAAVAQQQSLEVVMQVAAAAAHQGAEATTAMEARKGRARFLGPRAIGFQDAGATSIALLLSAWSEVVCTNATNP